MPTLPLLPKQPRDPQTWHSASVAVPGSQRLTCRAVMDNQDLDDAGLVVGFVLEGYFADTQRWEPLASALWHGGKVTNRQGQMVTPPPPSISYTNDLRMPIRTRTVLDIPRKLSVGTELVTE